MSYELSVGVCMGVLNTALQLPLGLAFDLSYQHVAGDFKSCL